MPMKSMAAMAFRPLAMIRNIVHALYGQGALPNAAAMRGPCPPAFDEWALVQTLFGRPAIIDPESTWWEKRTSLQQAGPLPKTQRP